MSEYWEMSDAQRAELDEVVDEDLRGALSLTTGFGLTELGQVLLTITGENDGWSWHWIVQLTDGDLAYITGGCDYTGWD